MTLSTSPDIVAFEEIALFRGLTRGELLRIQPLLHRLHLPAETYLFAREQPGEIAYVIVQGAIKIYMEQGDGGQVILSILGQGEVVGEMSLVDYLGRSASAMTIEQCDLLWMDRTSLNDCLDAIPELNHNLVRMLTRRLRMADELIQSLATLDVHGRIARQLLMLSSEYGMPAPGSRPGVGAVLIPFRLTQNDLADLVGASRGRVNQALADFKEQGSIAIDHEHRITVLDASALGRRCV
ncbi:MAG TPA: Crp/Fnr family transcriptional regulator [Chloroflexota bacterium]|nr:Crp/Fnr family transcriptional regulator [Chloroflexota bacterium]